MDGEKNFYDVSMRQRIFPVGNLRFFGGRRAAQRRKRSGGAEHAPVLWQEKRMPLAVEMRLCSRKRVRLRGTMTAADGAHARAVKESAF